MQFTYELNQRDFYDGFVAHRNRRPVFKWAFRIVIAILVGVTVLGVAALIARPSSEALKNLIPLILLGAFWALLLWVAPWRAAKSQFTKQPSAQGPRTLMVDDSGIHWRWDSGSSDIQWKNLIRWQETKTQFFIYSSPTMFNIVPKRALSDEEVTQFRSFLAKHIPSGRRAAAGQQ